jgi:hypothetical protein
MATVTVTKGYNNPTGWISGETVTPEKLNSSQTPSVSVTIDDGEVTASKLATGAVTGAAGGGKLAASVITSQTTIADPLADTDEFLVHDASASALRKVPYSSIAPTVTAAKLNGVAKDGSGSDLSAGSAPIFGCRAWVSFDGTKDTTNTTSTSNTNRLIRASGNVTSVLRNGTGDFTITFTTALPDANYAVMGITNGSTTSLVDRIVSVKGATSTGASDKTTTTLSILSGNTLNGAKVDLGEVSVAVFR